MVEKELYNQIKRELSREKIKEFHDALRGFMPMKKDEMMREYGADTVRYEKLKELNDYVEKKVVESGKSRNQIRETIRQLQDEYGLRKNYNQVKDTALRQLIKYMENK